MIDRALVKARLFAAQLLDGLIDAQRQLATTVRALVAVLCTRRAGKSRSAIRRLLRRALTVRGYRGVYVNTTKDECRAIAWVGVNGDGFKPLIDKLNAAAGEELATVNNTTLTITIKKLDAQIQLIGADDEAAINKLRGRAFHDVVIDEAQKMPHIAAFVWSVLGPAMLDFRGTIVLCGTPGKLCFGLFFDVTKEGSTAGNWERICWSVLDNPHFGATRATRYERTVAVYLAETGRTVDDPDVRREFFAEWVQADANYVYPVHAVAPDVLRFAPARYLPNGAIDWRAALDDLPRDSAGRRLDWRFVVGADLGYSPDPFAVVVWAWCDELFELFELGSWKQEKLIPDAQAEVLKDLRELLQPVAMVADAGGIGKAVVAGWSEGWLERHALPIDEAEKSQKQTNIELLGNDIRLGRVRVRTGGAWLAEASEHVWISSGTQKLVENPATANHCLDAGLYAFRAARHYRATPPIKRPNPGSADWYDEREREIEDAIYAQAQ